MHTSVHKARQILPQMPITYECVSKACHTHTAGCDSALKGEERLTPVTSWLNLENTLSGRTRHGRKVQNRQKHMDTK